MMVDTIRCIASTMTRTIAFSDGLTITSFTWCPHVTWAPQMKALKKQERDQEKTK